MLAINSLYSYSTIDRLENKFTTGSVRDVPPAKNRNEKGVAAVPYWAPVHHFKHRHLYFPKYQCYYDSYDGVYIYHDGEKWVRRYAVPSFMSNINFSSMQVVELEIDQESNPQSQFAEHFILYPPF